MKNTFVRAFVLSLTVIGFASATVISRAASTTTTAKVTQPALKMVPMCLPSDPSHCGLD